MTRIDLVKLAVQAITANRIRLLLILFAMAIGVSSVILLSALGEGARRYVTGEFAALGTNLLIVLPGRSETTGGQPPVMGETPRDLTLEDAMSLARSPYITLTAPINIGRAPVSLDKRERDVTILGSTASMQTIRGLEMGQGRFLPEADPRQALPVCVIGHEVRVELFGKQPALGRWLRVGDRRFRVIGILAQGGTSIGVDFDDLVIIPVAAAQAVFNTEGLFRVLAEARSAKDMQAGAADIRRIITERHEGEDDVTIISQDNVIATFDKIFSALTYGLAGIAAISLLVAGVLIMNIMLVSVAQRTNEIGLLKALGAPAKQIRALFITEASLLSLSGTVLGLIIGLGSAALLGRLYPTVPIWPPAWAIAAAAGIALATGLIFGVLPATRAARLDPVAALARR